MSEWPLLSLVIFLPLAGAGFILLIRGEPDVVAQNARSVALWTSGITFLLSLLIWANFDPSQGGFQLVEKGQWFVGVDINYHVGVDGISLWFVLLSTLLTMLCVISSWYSVTLRIKEFMVAFLVMDTLMVGVFCALDLVLFYLFFEGILIPMFLIIGIWGGPRRVYSAFKFFLYTLLGSVLFLVAILVMYYHEGTTDIPTLMRAEFDPGLQRWLWLAMFSSFAVKIPMWPFHTWLPDAHVEAPTAGSVLLAGVLLKLGGYGYLRFSLPMLPDASEFFTPLIYTLSVVAVIYTSLVALMQDDMKKLIAYSSVAHMGFVTIGIFTPNALGIDGSIIQMLSHGVVSAALFMGVVSSTTGYTPTRSTVSAAWCNACRCMRRPSCCSRSLRSACRAPGIRRRGARDRRRVRRQQLGGAAGSHRRLPQRRLHAVAVPAGDLRRPGQGRAQADAGSAFERDCRVRAARDPHAADGGLSRPVSRPHARVGRSVDGPDRPRAVDRAGRPMSWR